MTAEPDPLAAFRRRYRYVRDPGRDRWTLLIAPEGPLCGDCEDYAYTALWIIAGGRRARFWQMIRRREAELWYTRVHGTGEGHVMLFVKGLGWTDSLHKDWSATPHHPMLRRYGALKLALTLILK